ncbi:MAG: PEP-CTERM sorting domain-containing protein [Cytophagaceae bacterium]|nr:PEP-CTERM sorting domain-containing protein [Gemmatimonadaceae bacterium]
MMRKYSWHILGALAFLSARAEAQGNRVFCIPNTQACFSATFGFVPTPANPFYQNRLSSVITNLQGTYGGFNTPFGFLGLEYVQRWNALTSARTTTAFIDLPSKAGNVQENPFRPGFHFDQPTGGNGYMLLRGTGYFGCDRSPGDELWTWRTCPRDRMDGSVSFDMDLAYVDNEGAMFPATFKHFALRARTMLGSCTITPSTWLTERTNDACEERVLGGDVIASAAITPEPGTLLLLGSGLMGVAAHLRRRIRRRRHEF